MSNTLWLVSEMENTSEAIVYNYGIFESFSDAEADVKGLLSNDVFTVIDGDDIQLENHPNVVRQYRFGEDSIVISVFYRYHNTGRFYDI